MSPVAARNETAALTDSRLAALCAETVLRAFSEFDDQFQLITRRARDRFLARDWRGSYADAGERLRLYTKVLDALTREIREVMGARLCERAVWTGMKAVYSSLIAQSPKRDIAESFFNSLTRRVFSTEGVDQAIEFVDTDFDEAPSGAEEERQRVYGGTALVELIDSALTDHSLGFPAQHWSACAGAIHEAAARIRDSLGSDAGETRLDLIANVFYRGRGAYLVGRAIKGETSLPIAFCLRHQDERGINFDAVLIGETDLAILFSFTRAYFRVESECPYELVRSLQKLMPRKRLIDLYNAIGYDRHGKTEFYRDFVRHLRNSSDRFVVAEGTRGMVMLVFTLPSYDVVFKLIKDHFDYPKESDRAEVMRRYRLVFEHDRAGRLVEAHEFEHLRIARDRFDPGLLQDLLRDASSIVRLEGDDVVVR